MTRTIKRTNTGYTQQRRKLLAGLVADVHSDLEWVALAANAAADFLEYLPESGQRSRETCDAEFNKWMAMARKEAQPSSPGLTIPLCRAAWRFVWKCSVGRGSKS